jgi:protein phosphatase
VTHVGDSRAYLYAQGQLKLLTTDHSYVQRLQDAGQITAEEAAYHPQRNMLYNAVGQGSGLAIDTYTQMLPAEGKVILCSDGMWGLVSQPDIEQVLGDSLSLQEMAGKLVDLALAAGGSDNISVIVIDFRF